MNSSAFLLLNVGSRRPKIHYNALCVWCWILPIFHMIFQFHFIVLIFVILFLCRVHVANSHMYLNTHKQFVLNHKTVNFFTSVANDGNKFCGLWLRSLPINITETDISKQYMRRRSVHTLRNRFSMFCLFDTNCRTQHICYAEWMPSTEFTWFSTIKGSGRWRNWESKYTQTHACKMGSLPNISEFGREKVQRRAVDKELDLARTRARQIEFNRNGGNDNETTKDRLPAVSQVQETYNTHDVVHCQRTVVFSEYNYDNRYSDQNRM